MIFSPQEGPRPLPSVEGCAMPTSAYIVCHSVLLWAAWILNSKIQVFAAWYLLAPEKDRTRFRSLERPQHEHVLCCLNSLLALDFWPMHIQETNLQHLLPRSSGNMLRSLRTTGGPFPTHKAGYQLPSWVWCFAQPKLSQDFSVFTDISFVILLTSRLPQILKYSSPNLKGRKGVQQLLGMPVISTGKVPGKILRGLSACSSPRHFSAPSCSPSPAPRLVSKLLVSSWGHHKTKASCQAPATCKFTCVPTSPWREGKAGRAIIFEGCQEAPRTLMNQKFTPTL